MTNTKLRESLTALNKKELVDLAMRMAAVPKGKQKVESLLGEEIQSKILKYTKCLNEEKEKSEQEKETALGLYRRADKEESEAKKRTFKAALRHEMKSRTHDREAEKYQNQIQRLLNTSGSEIRAAG